MTEPGGSAASSADAQMERPPALASISRPALFLDFDGTLVDLAEDPDAIQVPRRLAADLSRLSEALDGRAAFVSGRSLADLERHVGPLPLSAAGSHGGEVRIAGESETRASSVALPPGVMSEAREFCAARPGLRFEDKPLGAGLHYRGAPEREAEVLGFAAAVSERHGLAIKRGKMVAELVRPGDDKGKAVAALLDEPPFAGGTPIFIGDDITDEDGFAAVAAAGGFGILVGPARETAARYRLDSPADVHAWLAP